MAIVGVGVSAPDDVDGLARQPDLLLGLAQRGVAQVLLALLDVLATAGEGDLAGVPAQVVAAAREDGVQLAVQHVQRHEHGGVDAAVHVEVRRLLGVEEARPQRVDGDGHARARRYTGLTISTRSSNMTSPSSVRWTGHFAAITMRRSTCSCGSASGRRTTSEKRVGHPRSAGEYSTSTSTGPTSQPLRSAYISSVIAVHEASETARYSCGLGAGVVTPGLAGLVGADDVVADLEVVLVGAGAAAARGGFHFRPRAVGECLAHIVLRAANRPAYSWSSGLNSRPVGTFG